MRIRLVLGAAILGTVAACGFWRAPLFLNNLHTLRPGELYRSAQPSAEELSRLIVGYGLRGVLSVRGGDGQSWFETESRVAAEHGVEIRDVRLSGSLIPPPDTLRLLIQHLDQLPRPLLIHCRGGVERAGLASAVAVLLEGGTLDEARDQFSLRHGFPLWLSRSQLPQLIDDYADWLAASGLSHHPEHLRRWASAAP